MGHWLVGRIYSRIGVSSSSISQPHSRHGATVRGCIVSVTLDDALHLYRASRSRATSVVVPPMSDTSASDSPVNQRAPTIEAAPTPDARSLRGLFVRGLMGNLLNPKAAVFYVALLPTFMRPDHGAPLSQALTLGSLALLIALGAAGAAGWAIYSLQPQLNSMSEQQQSLTNQQQSQISFFQSKLDEMQQNLQLVW